MNDEETATFALHVEAALEVVRDALVIIEEAAQQDDDAKWMDASRRFAGLISPMRDYLNGLQLGRNFPQQLGRKLEPLLADVDEIAEATRRIGLDDHVAALRGLVQEAHARS